MPLETDVLAPFDPTSYSSISGAALFQLVSGVAPTTDKGMILVTTDVATVPDVPDASAATGNTKWQRYLWLRIMATGVKVYAWNPAAAVDATYRQWAEITVSGIALASITGAMIAPNTITDSNIASVNISKVTGFTPSSSPTGTAGGDLAGTYPDPSIADSAVATAKIEDGAVTLDKIADGVFTADAAGRAKFAAGAIGENEIASAAITNAKVVDTFVLGATTKGAATLSDYALIADVAAANLNKKTLISSIQQAGTYSGLNAIPAYGAISLFPHGLAAVPKLVQLTLECVGDDAASAWISGDVGIPGWAALNNSEVPFFHYWCDATNVYVSRHNSSMELLHKTTGTHTVVTSDANFKIRIYARANKYASWIHTSTRRQQSWAKPK